MEPGRPYADGRVSPTKYVYETQLSPDQIDNEEDNEQFSISPSADPRKQLRAILAHGGGLPLVYKVMSDGLLSHTRILFYTEKTLVGNLSLIHI